jgi:hypothetical protein
MTGLRVLQSNINVRSGVFTCCLVMGINCGLARAELGPDEANAPEKQLRAVVIDHVLALPCLCCIAAQIRQTADFRHLNRIKVRMSKKSRARRLQRRLGGRSSSRADLQPLTCL